MLGKLIQLYTQHKYNCSNNIITLDASDMHKPFSLQLGVIYSCNNIVYYTCWP